MNDHSPTNFYLFHMGSKSLGAYSVRFRWTVQVEDADLNLD
jgi:hypothetical protein